MNPVSLFGLTSVICFALPLAAILIFRLYRHVSLIALALYYALTIVHCLAAENIPPVPNFTNLWDILYSYAQVPLILSSLLFFCYANERRQMVQKLIIAFVVYELMISLYFQFSAEATVYIMAPGLLIVILYTTFLFLRQLKFSLQHRKNIGRVLMLAAILFSYSSYGLVFYTYFIQKQSDVANIYSIYFVSSTIAAVLMSIGLFMMRHRIKELQELKVVRKELQMVFGS